MKRGPVLGLVPLGPVDPEILRYLVKALAEFLHLSVWLLPTKQLPMQTYHVGREQNNSTQLLEFLLDNDDPEPLILGITAVDLYIPIFTFVFGEAQLDGRAAIISTFRPGGGADSFQPPKRFFLSRLLKLSLHELGHSFGLGHCHQPRLPDGFFRQSGQVRPEDSSVLPILPDHVERLFRQIQRAPKLKSYLSNSLRAGPSLRRCCSRCCSMRGAMESTRVEFRTAGRLWAQAGKISAFGKEVNIRA